ncbi:MAG: MFS transporter [Deltaproteobacteria bacterium]|nr:MFS transporter [Deltaproteobacteria bacterium]
MTTNRSLSPSTVLTLLISMGFIGSFAMIVMPPLFSEIITDINLTKAQMGSLMGITMLSAIIFAPIGGMVADKIGCRWTMGIGTLVVAVAGGLRGAMVTPFGLIACMFIIGVGFNFLMPSIPKVLGQWFTPDKLAFTNGLNVAGAGVGGAIGVATAASLLSPAFGGWRGVMVATSVCVFLTGILWVLIYRDPIAEDSVKAQNTLMLANFKRVAKLKNIQLLAAMALFQSLGFLPVMSFLPISLEERGIAHAGELTGIVMATAVVFNIIGGRISDRIGKRKPIIFFGTAIAGFCVLTYASLSTIPLILVLMITGAGVGSLAPVMLTIPIEMEEVGPELAATAVGFILMFQSISGFFGPILAGKLIDITSYTVGFIFMGCAIILSALFVIPMKEPARGTGKVVAAPVKEAATSSE